VAAFKLQARAASAPRDLKAASAADHAGGEAGAGAGVAADAAEGKVERIRLTVRPLDGLGEPPAVARAPSDPSLSPLRGREYVLVVEADGSVREAAASRPAPEALAKSKDLAANTAVTAESPSIFLELRFAPGDRPRRLLVRVD
jgi:hypothetical protein